jgi:hypothetical protein
MKPLPCPFCGGPASAEFDDYSGWFIGCDQSASDGCQVETCGGPFKTKREAIAVWNRRATNTPPTAQTHHPTSKVVRVDKAGS